MIGALAAAGVFALGTGAGIEEVGDGLGAPATLVVPRAQDAAWSPDATRLAFARTFPADGLGVANADGSDVHVLTRTEGVAGDMQPAWSPDGTRIAFVRQTPTTSTLLTVGADGSAMQTVIAPDGGERIIEHPRFLPGGRRLLFLRDGDLWSARVDGSSGRRLAATSHLALVPSPDGRAYAVGMPGGPTYVTDDRGSRLRRVSAGEAFPVAFSDDAQRLLLGHFGQDGRPTSTATIVDPAGIAAPRTVSRAPDGLTTRGLGVAAWHRPAAAPLHAPSTADHEPPASFVSTADGRLVRLGTDGHPVALSLSWLSAPSLLTIDRTGVTKVDVAWVQGHAKPRWRDATGPDAFGDTVPGPGPGRFRLLVRARDTLLHASTRSAEVIVKLTP